MIVLQRPTTAHAQVGCLVTKVRTEFVSLPSSVPDISIVVPCYKAASLAKRSAAALELALSGKGVSWELIVVDDGGGDFDLALAA